MTNPIWTFCKYCMVQRDHIFVDDKWMCGKCGTKNETLIGVAPIRSALTEVAETYLEKNPEE